MFTVKGHNILFNQTVITAMEKFFYEPYLNVATCQSRFW